MYFYSGFKVKCKSKGKCEGKSKVVLVHTMKADRGRTGIVPLIPELG